MIPSIPNIKFADNNNFFLIAGPCVVENKDVCFEIAETIKGISEKYKIPFIFKASYKKANRTRTDSFTGIGNQTALEIIESVKNKFNVPVLTDIHESMDAEEAARYVDVLQIPAFLCRQTDLLIAAAQTGKFVNVKKGQFLSAEAMKFAIEKIKSAGNNNVMLTERGTTFGYQDLVVDFRGIPTMKSFNVPVVLDVTHSLQQPNQSSGVTGGLPNLISTMAKAGIATGVDGIFIETHPVPEKALSDGANMLKISLLDNLIEELVKIKKAIN